MTKKIFAAILIIFIMSFTLFAFAGCANSPAKIIYDSPAELQAAWPEYYYFDFDSEKIVCCGVQSAEETRLGKDPSDYKYYGYAITYEEYPVEFESDIRYVSFIVRSDKERTIEEICPSLKEVLPYLKASETYIVDTGTKDGEFTYDLYTIDGIECIITHASICYGAKYRNYFQLYFVIEDVTYYTVFIEETLVNSDTEQITKECFISLVEPIIENRHKGTN